MYPVKIFFARGTDVVLVNFDCDAVCTSRSWFFLTLPILPPDVKGVSLPQPETPFISPIRSRPCPGRLFFARITQRTHQKTGVPQRRRGRRGRRGKETLLSASPAPL